MCTSVVDRPHQLAEHQGAMKAVVHTVFAWCLADARLSVCRVGYQNRPTPKRTAGASPSDQLTAVLRTDPESARITNRSPRRSATGNIHAFHLYAPPSPMPAQRGGWPAQPVPYHIPVPPSHGPQPRSPGTFRNNLPTLKMNTFSIKLLTLYFLSAAPRSPHLAST